MKKALLLVTTMLFIPAAALGISQNDLHAVLYDTNFFDPTSSCEVDLSVNLSGSDNEQKAFNYFVSKSLTAPQSAGIVANLYAESSVRPNAQQDGSNDPFPKDGVGFGIAQWTYTDRQQPLEQLAHTENQPVNTLAVQLDYVWDELNGISPANHEGGLSEVKAAADAASAAVAFMNAYERPKDPATQGPIRAKYANQIMQLYGGTAATSGITPSTVTGGCPGATVPGQGTAFLDNFTIYYQFQGPWANQPYGDNTIAANGCGPTSMAMIITNLTGQSVTPDVTAKYALDQNQYVTGAGSKHTIGPVLAQHWNLKSSLIGASVPKISAALQSGSLVIAAGRGALPFTTGGHFIVIRGIAPDGKWKVGDPGHSNTSSQEWDPNQLVDEMAADSVYAISK